MLALLVLASCGDDFANRRAGIVELRASLSVGGITSVHYEVSGNGLNRAGDIPAPTGATTSVTTLVTNIPAGTGYTVTLSARSPDEVTTCQGSGTFSVTARTTTPVTVFVLCRTMLDRGAVAINSSFTFCPSIVDASAIPAEMALGDDAPIIVSAQAIDHDDDVLSYEWTASSGTFAASTAASTTYRCTQVGPVDLALRVTDGDCEERATGVLRCLPFCSNKADGTACDDGDACTQVDRCDGGECRSQPVVCAALDACHVPGTCAPTSGLCSNPAAPDGTACALPEAVAACQTGACAVVSCTTGRGNCNATAADGCETPLNTQLHCGACGHACGAGTTCQTGRCLSAPPTGVVASAGGWRTRLSWLASAGATSYEISRSMSAGGPFDRIGDTSALAFVDQAVLGATTYFYAVAAVNAEGASAPSAPAMATTRTKEVCVSNNAAHAVFTYGANQTGAATPLRTLGGTVETFGWPTTIASTPSTDELFVMQRGGRVDVFPFGAAGPATPLRSLAGIAQGASPTQILLAMDVDAAAGELFAADFAPGGRLVAVSTATGARTRALSGPGVAAQLGNPGGLLVDRPHGELLVTTAGPDPVANFSRVLAFDLATANGPVAPLRTLGATPSTQVGRWAVAMDLRRQQVLTSCNCDNAIRVFERGASGGAAPTRTILLPASVVAVHALLVDEAADTVWALSRSSTGAFSLGEYPRGANGPVVATRPEISVTGAGFLARCN